MKAIALTGLGRLEIIDRPVPSLQSSHDVLLEIKRIGVCGSDLHYFLDGRIAHRTVEFPFVLGHECSAVVREVGSAVTRVEPGDEVAVDPAISCHTCDQCLAGREHTCRRLRFLGCPGELEGCLSEFLVMPEACLYATNGALTLDEAVLCEPLSIGLYACRLADLAPGGAKLSPVVGILGAGPIGLSVLLASRALGAATVVMTDPVAERVAFARQMGASWTGNPDQASTMGDILQSHPGGLDVVFECAGRQEALDQAVALLKPGGTLAVIGIPREERVSFAIDHLRRKEITLVNVRRQNQCVEPALQLVASGQVRLAPLLSHRFPAEQAQAAFECVAGYREGVIKAVIEF